MLMLSILKDHSGTGRVCCRVGASGGFLTKVIMQVRVDQACIGSGDAWGAKLAPLHVRYLGIKLVHQLCRLDKLVLIGVPQLGELVDVLGGADFQRHLNR